MTQTVNKSGLRPKGQAVLVRPDAGVKGLIEIPASARGAMDAIEQRVVVIEVGPEAWKDEAAPRALPGDTVLVGKYVGHMAVGPKDGVQYRLVNGRDIFCGIEVEHE